VLRFGGMTKKSTPSDVVKAFRKAADELDCFQSERRFQEVLFSIWRHKPLITTSVD